MHEKLTSKNYFPKGQLISKRLFGVLKLFQKRTKNST